MQVSETKADGLVREFKITVPAGDIEKEMTSRLKKLVQSVTLPGFRPGKAPVPLLRKKYGPSVLGEVLENTVNDTSQRTLTERGLRPAVQPKIEITSFADGADLEYDMRVELMPEIEPVDFSQISLERLTCKPDEREVEEALERLARVHGTTEPVTSPRKAVRGDVLLIDFKGTVDGETFPGGAATSYLLELGSGSLLPGFEDQLVGAEAGKSARIEVRFPENYGPAELAGKDAVFEVDVRELRETKLAGIDDSLAGKAGLDSLDALRTAIRDDQEHKLKSIQRMRVKRALLDHFAETVRFEIPASMVDQEFDQIWENFETRRKDGELDGDEDFAGKSDEEARAELREIAERRVRLGLLLSELGRLNDITVTQEDVNRGMASEAQRFPGREKAIFDYYQKTPEAADSLRAPIFEDKVVDFILELVTITDREVTLDELMNGPDDDATGDEKKKKPARTKKTRSKAKAG